MVGGVKIIRAGLHTTIQDKGRLGYAKYGVPQSGAMDQQSFQIANAILNNDTNCAAIEWYLMPPILQFLHDTTIVLTGAKVSAKLSGTDIAMNSVIPIRAGDQLRLKTLADGAYGYIGILGGFQTEERLGSRSFYTNITECKVIVANDILPFPILGNIERKGSKIKSSSFLKQSMEIPVFKGVEFDKLDQNQQQKLLGQTFTVSTHSNRMAILLNEPLQNTLQGIRTSPVLPGTVQLTPSGQLVLLMRDAQVTGGYPRVLQLTEQGINRLAQTQPKNKLEFTLK